MPLMGTELGEGYERPDPGEYFMEEREDSVSARAGRQISEITGPTRDLLTNLLSPLRALDSLTGIGNRIYDLLDERLMPHSGVTIGEININGTNLSQAEMIEALEEALGERVAFAGGTA